MLAIDIFGLAAALGVVAYILLVFYCWLCWASLPVSAPSEISNASLTVSIVIVARNEASAIAHLLADIQAQNYPHHLLEVMLVDDNSEDDTVAIAQSFAASNELVVKVIRLDSADGTSKKKMAIMQAASLSTSSILLLTDADCRVGARWVSSHIDHYECFGHAQLVFGAFCFAGEGAFVSLLNLEAMSLTGVAAVTNLAQKPTMCSGANISYKRELLKELRPFDDNQHVASGDDEFMLHAVHRAYPGATYYNKRSDSLVITKPPHSMTALYHQRRRWAGKWKAHKSIWPKALALVVVAGNLGFAASLVAFIITKSFFWILPIGVKLLTEFALCARVSKNFGLRGIKRYILLMEIIYPFYAIFFGIASNFGKYRWKGREYK